MIVEGASLTMIGKPCARDSLGHEPHSRQSLHMFYCFVDLSTLRVISN